MEFRGSQIFKNLGSLTDLSGLKLGLPQYKKNPMLMENETNGRPGGFTSP